MLQCSHEKREGKKAQGRQEMKREREREKGPLREGDERARVADAGVGQVLDVAALLVPDPFAPHRRRLRSTLRRFEGGEGSEEDSDRVTTADGVLGLAEVRCEFIVRLRRILLVLRGLCLLLMVVVLRSAAAAAERDRLHTEVIELLDPFPHRTTTTTGRCLLSEILARQRRSSREVVRTGRVIVRVPEPGPPVTKVGRDDKEAVRVGEVRGEEGAKSLFGRSRDGTDEDGHELDVATGWDGEKSKCRVQAAAEEGGAAAQSNGALTLQRLCGCT